VTNQHDATDTGLRSARVLVWLVYAFVVAATVILLLAFFLMLFNASATAEFTQWVYRSADRVLQPFRGIFPTVPLGERGSVIDFAVLFAIIVYGIFAQFVAALVGWLDRKTVEHRAAVRRAALAEQQHAAGSWTATGPPVAGPPPSHPSGGVRDQPSA
jgi:uncharacterized protein YggT (Ycf19 family)